MKIKFVEELVGITRKNIRFYEEQGLLFPSGRKTVTVNTRKRMSTV